MRKGWFKIPGVQDGDRTAAEQLLGLEPALRAAKGKTVLDLGSAEGLIARQFAVEGARAVTGIELVEDHVKVARRICQGLPVTFVNASLQPYIEKQTRPPRYDVVLALSIAHKLHDPAVLLRFAARSAVELVVFRGPGKQGMYWDGWLSSKHTETRCHVPTVMGEEGFTEGDTLDSAQGERVQYWHRAA